jgi:hypothetical protein
MLIYLTGLLPPSSGFHLFMTTQPGCGKVAIRTEKRERRRRKERGKGNEVTKEYHSWLFIIHQSFFFILLLELMI